MPPFRLRFLELAVACGALRFGEFTLKSGRVSPYFFNAGRIDGGAALATLGGCYADAVSAAGVEFDMLFGPAYKGIPLATSAAIAFAARGRDLPLAFDRKEAKAHGEGGVLIGAPLAGRVLVVDDVITAGTAVRESLRLIAREGAQAAGLLVALDRQERGSGPSGSTSMGSAAQEIAAEFGVPVIGIATLDDLLAFAATAPALVQHADALVSYRARYGVATP